MNRLRRQLAKHLLILAGITVISPDWLADAEPWERLSKVLTKPASIDDATLSHLETIIGCYWYLFYKGASHTLLTGVVGYFHSIISLLHSSHPTSVYKRLCTIATETALLAGRISLDIGNSDAVRGYNQAAFEAVRETGNDALHAVVLGRMTSLPTQNNQPQKVLPLFQEANRLASQSATATSCAWLAANEAEAWANLHEESNCLKALERAATTAIHVRTEDDPYWTNFDRPLMLGFQGICLIRLHQPEAARSALQEGLTLMNTSFARQRSILLIDTAMSYTQQCEIEEACILATQALALLQQICSAMVWKRMSHLWQTMEPWKTLQCVKDLDEYRKTVKPTVFSMLPQSISGELL